MGRYRLRISLLLLLLIIMFGTVGYTVIEGMLPFDAFYMTLITISTVGFAEISPLTHAGRLLTVIIIISGISLLSYTLGQLARVFIEGELHELLGRRKFVKQIAHLHDHFIICGFGRIGEVICRELADDNITFIVIETNEENIARIEREHYLYIPGNAADEKVLLEAGLEKARGLVTAVTSDADNVFITLTAKGLRPDIFVLSRAADLRNESKLLRAGASRVVCPYNMGGSRMAQILKKPTVVDFLDVALASRGLDLKIEETIFPEHSYLVGKTLVESNLRHDFGVIIMAIKKANKKMVFNPGPGERLEAGDVLVSVGKKDDVGRMARAVLETTAPGPI
ncbi:MAG: potassium channel protein [Desulfocapsaceae bacterium]